MTDGKMKFLNYSTISNSVLNCDEKEVKYYVIRYDHFNNELYWDFFKSKQDAVNFVYNDVGFNTTFDQFKEGEPMAEEKNGQLYWHWFVHEYSKKSLLFDPEEYEQPPETKEQFVDYMSAGNVLTLNWGDSPIDYCVGNCLMIRYCLSTNEEFHFPPSMEHIFKRDLSHHHGCQYTDGYENVYMFTKICL